MTMVKKFLANRFSGRLNPFDFFLHLLGPIFIKIAHNAFSGPYLINWAYSMQQETFGEIKFFVALIPHYLVLVLCAVFIWGYKFQRLRDILPSRPMREPLFILIVLELLGLLSIVVQVLSLLWLILTPSGYDNSSFYKNYLLRYIEKSSNLIRLPSDGNKK